MLRVVSTDNYFTNSRPIGKILLKADTLFILIIDIYISLIFPKGFHYSAITMCLQVHIATHTWKICILHKLQHWELCNVLTNII